MILERRNNALDWLKWFAIFTMFVDHLKYLSSAYTYEFYLIGRAAYPIFAILCGINFALYTKSPIRFFVRVLILGLCLIPLEFLVSNTLFPLNPIITLAIGLGICLTLRYFFASPNWAVERGLMPLLGFTLLTGFVAFYNYSLFYTIFSYGVAGIVLVLLGALYGYGKGSKWWSPQVATSSVFLSIVVALGLNYYNIETRILGAFWVVVFFLFVFRPNVPPCPLPNNYLLYLSFPISIILPFFIKHFMLMIGGE